MEDLPKSKKSILYIGQFIVTAVMYGIVMSILDRFFESDHQYSTKSIVIQSIVFGALFTLWNLWSANRKKKGGSDKL